MRNEPRAFSWLRDSVGQHEQFVLGWVTDGGHFFLGHQGTARHPRIITGSFDARTFHRAGWLLLGMSRISSRSSSFIAPTPKLDQQVPAQRLVPSASLDTFEMPKRGPKRVTFAAVSDVVGAIPDGTAKIEGGVDLGVVKLKGGASASSTTEADGTKVLKVEVHGEASASGSGGAVGGSASAQASGSITIRIPPGCTVDPATIDPLDPATWPEGTEVKLEGDISGALTGSVGKDAKIGDVRAKLKAQLGITGEAGVDVTIKKTGPEVTVAPHTKVGVNGEVGASGEIDGVEVGASASGSLESTSSHARTVEFDLATPEGRAAFEEFERTGLLPGPGPGITKWKDVQVDGVTGEYEGEISIGKTKLKLFGDDWESTRTTTTTADGSKVIEDRIRNDHDNAAIVIERTFNPDGTEDVSKRKVRQELKVTAENEKQLEAMLTAAYGVPYDLQPGQTVSVEMTPDDLVKMAEQVDAYGWDSFWTSITGYDRRMHSELESGAEIEGTDIEIPNLDVEAVTRMAKDQEVRLPGTVKVTNPDGSQAKPLTAEEIAAQIVKLVEETFNRVRAAS